MSEGSRAFLAHPHWKTKFADQASIGGKSVWVNQMERPVVCVNAGGEDVEQHRIGLMPSVDLPDITLGSGQLNGRLAVGVARYDSATNRHSEISAVAPAPTTGIIETADLGTAGDAALKDAAARTKLLQTFVVPDLSSGGAQVTGQVASYQSATLTLKRSAAALIGTLQVKIQQASSSTSGAFVDIAVSELVDASTLTAAYAEYEFTFTGRPLLAAGQYYVVLTWSEAFNVTNFVNWKKYAGTTVSAVSFPDTTDAGTVGVTVQSFYGPNPANWTPGVTIAISLNQTVAATGTITIVDNVTGNPKLSGTYTGGGTGYLVITPTTYSTQISIGDTCNFSTPAASSFYQSWQAGQRVLLTLAAVTDLEVGMWLVVALDATTVRLEGIIKDITGSVVTVMPKYVNSDPAVSDKAFTQGFAYKADGSDAITVYDAAAVGDTLKFSMTPEDSPRTTLAFFNLQNASLTINNLQDFVGDTGTDTYDQLSIMVFSDANTCVEFDRVGTDQTTYTINVDLAETIPQKAVFVPYINRPFPSVRKMLVVGDGGVERIVGVGQGGFDPWFDGERVFYFTGNGIVEDGVIADVDEDTNFYEIAPNSTTIARLNLRDGTYIIRGIVNQNGQEFARGYVGTDDNGLVLSYVVRAYSDLDRTSPMAWSNYPLTGTTSITWEISRQVLCHVTKGSAKAWLSHTATTAFEAWDYATNQVILDGAGNAYYDDGTYVDISVPDYTWRDAIVGSYMQLRDADVGNAIIFTGRLYQRWSDANGYYLRFTYYTTAPSTAPEAGDSFNIGPCPADDVARQYMCFQNAKVGDLGTEQVYKTTTATVSASTGAVTVSGDFEGSATEGAGLVFETAWRGTSGVENFTLLGDNRKLFFGRASEDINISDETWGATGLGYFATISSIAEIQTIGTAKGTPVAICFAGELYAINIPSFVDPTDLTTLAVFDVGAIIQLSQYPFAGSCISPSVANTTDGDLMWIGGEAVWRFGGAVPIPVTRDNEFFRWNNLDQKQLPFARLVGDPDHIYTPSIRITPNPTLSTHLVYLPDRQAFLNYGGIGVFTAGCTVTTMGGPRVLYGTNTGRLGFFPGVARTSGTSYRDAYAWPQLPGTISGTCTEPDPLTPNQLVDGSASFSLLGQQQLFTDAGVRVVKISSSSTEAYEWATITGLVDATHLNVTPDSTWTFTADVTYTYQIGPREFGLRFPHVVAQEGMGSVLQLENFNIEFEDLYVQGSSIDTPVVLELIGSSMTSTLGAQTTTLRYFRSGFSVQWLQQYVMAQLDNKLQVRISGLGPIDSVMSITAVWACYGFMEWD